MIMLRNLFLTPEACSFIKMNICTGLFQEFFSNVSKNVLRQILIAKCLQVTRFDFRHQKARTISVLQIPKLQLLCRFRSPVNGLQALTIFTQCSILDVWLDVLSGTRLKFFYSDLWLTGGVECSLVDLPSKLSENRSFTSNNYIIFQQLPPQLCSLKLWSGNELFQK